MISASKALCFLPVGAITGDVVSHDANSQMVQRSTPTRLTAPNAAVARLYCKAELGRHDQGSADRLTPGDQQKRPGRRFADSYD
jgi:hypothetical protein